MGPARDYRKLDVLGVTEAEIYPDSMCKNTDILSRTLWIVGDSIKLTVNNILTSDRLPQTWIEATFGSEKVNGKEKLKKLCKKRNV